MEKHIKCPYCGWEDDYVEFAFVEHREGVNHSKSNPSPFKSIFMCPNLHVFDEEGNTLGSSGNIPLQ